MPRASSPFLLPCSGFFLLLFLFCTSEGVLDLQAGNAHGVCQFPLLLHLSFAVVKERSTVLIFGKEDMIGEFWLGDAVGLGNKPPSLSLSYVLLDLPIYPGSGVRDIPPLRHKTKTLLAIPALGLIAAFAQIPQPPLRPQ